MNFMFKSFSLLEINWFACCCFLWLTAMFCYVNIPVQLSDNSFLFFSSRTRTTGFPCCTQPRIPQPHLSRSTKTCLRRKTRTNSLITCRTSDFSVKGFCVMMETEEHPPWTGTLEAIFMKTFWEQLYSFFCKHSVTYSISLLSVRCLRTESTQSAEKNIYCLRQNMHVRLLGVV